MALKTTLCIRNVVENKQCLSCEGLVIKNGFSKAQKQRFKCKVCSKTFIHDYTYKACMVNVTNNIVSLLKEGVGIRGIARLLSISTTTLLRRILSISKKVQQPALEPKKVYEVDELCTFVKYKSKRIWIVYALEKATKKVVSFNVGARTNVTLGVVVNTLISHNAQCIYTDKLRNYSSIVPKDVHKTKRYGTNCIERMNLTLRMHIKRLQRKSICFTRSDVMLFAVLKIYFWYG